MAMISRVKFASSALSMVLRLCDAVVSISGRGDMDIIGDLSAGLWTCEMRCYGWLQGRIEVAFDT